MKSKFLVLVVSLLMTCVSSASLSFDNENWNKVLNQYVNDKGFVDYKSLSRNRENFDFYIDSIKSTGPKTKPDLFPQKNDKLAYYINSYNALVFEGVLKRGPEDKSVWRGLISGLNFFIRMKVMIDGEVTSLKKLEDDVIREEFKDPRIHAAINCASVSCPRLPKQAFEADQLDLQLDAAMREFVQNQSNVNVDTKSKRIYLSKIFDWFEDDFLEFEKNKGNANPNVISYINRFRPADDQLPQDYEIKILKYNKGINKQA